MAIIFLAVFLVYIPSVRNGFVYDDIELIQQNPDIRSIDSVPKLLASEDTQKGAHTGYYRPSTYLSFMLDYHLWGNRPAGFHLTNTFLHAMVTVLVYLLMIRLGIGPLASLLGTLFFGLTPANSETVNFIAGGRNTLLCASFMLGTLLAHFQGRPGLAVPLFVVAAFSKEFALLLPAMMVVHEFIMRRGESWQSLKGIARMTAPYVVVVLLYLLARHLVLSGLYSGRLGEPLFIRILNIPKVFMLYVRLMVFPFKLSPVWYLVYDTGMGTGIAALLAALLAAVVYKVRRHRLVLYGFIWFVLFFLPVCGIISFDDVLGADRYIYVSSIGVSIIVAYLCALTGTRRALGIMAVLLVAYTVKDLTRIRVWRDNTSIFRQMMTEAPQSSVGFYNMGLEFYRVYEYDIAEELLTKASKRKPAIAESFFVLSTIKRLRGDLKGALEDIDKALSLKPEAIGMMMVKSMVLEKLGRKEEATLILNRLESENPGMTKSLRTRAWAFMDKGNELLSQGKEDEALKSFSKAMEYDPELAEAVFQIGNIMASRGRYEEAARHFRHVTELRPENVEGYYNLSLALKLLGDTKGAEDAMSKFLDLGGTPTWETRDILGGASP